VHDLLLAQEARQMTKYTSDSKQRASKKYRDIHAKLAIEMLEGKLERKKRKSVAYRAKGGE
jgi:hypothetical protein